MPPGNTESGQQKTLVRKSAFKYYIHDGAEACRFQLIGELAETDIPELDGCWRTVRTIVAGRKLVFDLRELRTVDEQGKQWLAGMATEGAIFIPESYLRTGLAPQTAPQATNSGAFAKLIAWLRGSRVLSTESPTQAP